MFYFNPMNSDTIEMKVWCIEFLLQQELKVSQSPSMWQKQFLLHLSSFQATIQSNQDKDKVYSHVVLSLTHTFINSSHCQSQKYFVLLIYQMHFDLHWNIG